MNLIVLLATVRCGVIFAFTPPRFLRLDQCHRIPVREA